MIKSEHLVFKEMQLEDVKQFKNWGRHSSKMYDDYNFTEQTDEDIKNWYNWKVGVTRSTYYTIFLKDIAIGYISFKNKKPVLKTAEIGIVFDPNYIDRGFGYETLMKMLSVYFIDLEYNKIYLDVAQYNKRAYHLYKKLGFEKYSSMIMKYPNGRIEKESKDYLENKDAFVNFLGIAFFKADRLSLTKERFEELWDLNLKK
ncbi:Protein N-acetyltransferase, RimJ/RimL family [Peptoniphilus asaccharolyticus DSM 20463]|uniref:Protein N-acetyltransferase, RimJ/RimL family n=1 Tax=Peptoniphilus asaccharolyticus DSM 20463 TaxID=573058 RepID=A0A1W1V3D0_PEPAS|nr:GNAT family protein [Peptoniphilus asaccharolyticus]MBL7576217.1 GNAT family N-acetyltransferase [Peptoniphilus asaccharolyticus]SMB87859.1 Protein N-acetyltransferase, RimJ/RimL family [Peptoniphilus asaccharolyticus DSM 20463]